MKEYTIEILKNEVEVMIEILVYHIKPMKKEIGDEKYNSRISLFSYCISFSSIHTTIEYVLKRLHSFKFILEYSNKDDLNNLLDDFKSIRDNIISSICFIWTSILKCMPKECLEFNYKSMLVMIESMLSRYEVSDKFKENIYYAFERDIKQSLSI